MNRPARSIEWLVWGALALTIAGIIIAFARTRLQQAAFPDVALPLSYPVPDFTLTNQNGEAVSLKDLRGQVWVADLIFTRCAGPCPRLTSQMSQLQQALLVDPGVKLITLTTDPEYDSPAVLKRYAERFGANAGRWMFLTGTREQIARLAVDGLKLVALEKKPAERQSPEDLFIHSTLLVVVDAQGRLRVTFDSEDGAWKGHVLGAVKKLLREK
jgi:protein SCO1/2